MFSVLFILGIGKINNTRKMRSLFPAYEIFLPKTGIEPRTSGLQAEYSTTVKLVVYTEKCVLYLTT